VDWFHAVGNTIAPEQKAGANLVYGGAQDCWLRWCARPIVFAWNTAPETACEESRRIFAGKQPKASGNQGCYCFWTGVGKSLGDLLRSPKRIIHYQAPVHYQSNTDSRPPLRATMGLQCKMKYGDIQGRRFAGASGQIKHFRPFIFYCKILDKTYLPRKG
jgi:hypothetical protein